MVVRDLNVEGVTVDESEADAPLVIDGDCVLPRSVSPELVESIPRRAPEVMQVSRQVDLLELPPRPTCDLGRESLRSAGHEQLLRLLICKRFDHGLERNASRDTCQAPVLARTDRRGVRRSFFGAFILNSLRQDIG